MPPQIMALVRVLDSPFAAMHSTLTQLRDSHSIPLGRDSLPTSFVELSRSTTLKNNPVGGYTLYLVGADLPFNLHCLSDHCLFVRYG